MGNEVAKENIETEVIEPKDEFDAAFVEAVAESDKDVKKPEGERDNPKEDQAKAKEDVEKGVGKEEKKEVSADDKTKKSEEVKTDAEKDKEKEKEKTPESEADKKYKDLEHKHKTLEGMYNKLTKDLDDLKESKEKEKKAEATKKEPPEDLGKMFKSFVDTLYDDLDDITKKTIKEYDTEFDTPSKIENIKREHALKKTILLIEERTEKKLKESMTSFAEALKETIQPLFDTVEQTTQSSHYSSIKQAHPDFETYRDNGELKAWIDEQPNLLKESLTKVYSKGKSADVIDMYNMFKKDKGLDKKKDEKAEAEKDKDQLDKDERKKNLETVKGKTSGVNIGSTGKAESFDEAFDEALNKTQRR